MGLSCGCLARSCLPSFCLPSFCLSSPGLLNKGLAGDPRLQLSLFNGIEGPFLQGAAAEIGFRRPAQPRHQIGAGLGQGWQLWRRLTEQLAPERLGGIDQQAAMLQQDPMAPELGAADPFGAVCMD